MAEREVAVQFMGVHARCCRCVWRSTRAALTRSTERTWAAADRKQVPAPKYVVGQQVWLAASQIPLKEKSKKLSPHFLGPYTISRVINDASVQLKLSPTLQVNSTFHVAHIKPLSASPLCFPPRLPPPPWIIDGHYPAYTVRRILDVHHRGRGLQYLVDWEGYGSEERSWVTTPRVLDKEMLRAYHRAHPKKPSGLPGGEYTCAYHTTEDNGTMDISHIATAEMDVSLLQSIHASTEPQFPHCVKESDVLAVKLKCEDFLNSSSSMLDKSLEEAWTTKTDKYNDSYNSLAEKFLDSVERLIEIANIVPVKKANIDIDVRTCNMDQKCNNSVFDVKVTLERPGTNMVKTTGFKELEKYLPHNDTESTVNSIVVSTIISKKKKDKSDELQITIDFPLNKTRKRNTELKCVAWDNKTKMWSENGCKWEGPSRGNPKMGRCICTHLSSFSILMSREPLNVTGMTIMTYTGLSISIVSLIVTLIIEVIVWSHVVRTNTLYLRHSAHVNISLCLLVADCCFLASEGKPSEVWCVTFTLLKHFFYLAMFFWMLCLSTTLLHQAVFLFHKVSKKQYLRFSLVLGYAVPFVIVFATFLSNESGAEGMYYSKETCWLVYKSLMKGSIHTFIVPVLIIVFFNIFSMVIVIIKLLDHKSTEKVEEKEIMAAKTVLRSVILLTPIFGVTWVFGSAVMVLDLTEGVGAFIANYAFILFNAFQGLFILLTTCIGDKMTRDALLKSWKKKAKTSNSESTTKLETMKK
ncbi:adhesion G protein-coupled receptor F5 [Pholidichthys leucotaenia]